MGKLGPAARSDAFPAIVAILQSEPDVEVVQAAVRSLNRFSPSSAPDVSEIAPLLKAKMEPARVYAAVELGRLGYRAQPAGPGLVEALADRDPGEKKAAATALGQIGPTAQKARPALVKSLNDRNVEPRRAVANALLQIGPEAADGTAWIVALSDDD